jgi:hypothetical protein
MESGKVLIRVEFPSPAFFSHDNPKPKKKFAAKPSQRKTKKKFSA